MNNRCKDDDYDDSDDDDNDDVLNLLKMMIIFMFRFNRTTPPSGFEADSFCVSVLTELNITFIETVILALPELEEEEEVSLSVIQPYWEALEEMVEGERVLSLGIADLNKEQLEKLHNWAKVT